MTRRGFPRVFTHTTKNPIFPGADPGPTTWTGLAGTVVVRSLLCAGLATSLFAQHFSQCLGRNGLTCISGTAAILLLAVARAGNESWTDSGRATPLHHRELYGDASVRSTVAWLCSVAVSLVHHCRTTVRVSITVTSFGVSLRSFSLSRRGLHYGEVRTDRQYEKFIQPLKSSASSVLESIQ